MTEYKELVEETRVRLQVEEWSKGIKYIHANNGIIETKFNNGDIEYEDTSTGKKTWKRKRATKRTLINKFLRRLK